jgi:glycosyltransferase involved in cell wall biosynthesis
VLRGRDVLAGRRWIVFNAPVTPVLRRAGTELAIVGGWNQPAFWEALAYGRLTGRPTIVWVESTERDERTEAAPVELAKRVAAAGAAAFLVPGRAAASYVASLGVEPERIAVAPNAVDLRLFGDRVALEREGRDELRRERRLERPTFLCVSRLSPEKGVDVLARAAAGVRADVVLVGDGPDRTRIRSLAGENVRLLGRVDGGELLRWYAAADAFVMPSRSETWGIALQEAAAAGLPLVATEAPGAGHDLIEEGVNGLRVPVDDVEALRAALVRVAEDAAFRERARPRTLELASGLTADAWADAVAALAHRLLE